MHKMKTQYKQMGIPHGAKAAEVYGIVGYLLSLIAFGPCPCFYLCCSASPIHPSVFPQQALEGCS